MPHCDQLAFYCTTDEDALRVKALFGLENESWVCDTVTARVMVHDQSGTQKGVNVAELQFCEKLGIQFEIIRYVSGPHWCQYHPLSREWTYIAHVGLHLDDDEDWPPMPGCPLVQEAETLSHTNQELNRQGKRYAYRIYEMATGVYIKYIKRRYV